MTATVVGSHCDFRTLVVPLQPDGVADAPCGGESAWMVKHEPVRRDPKILSTSSYFFNKRQQKNVRLGSGRVCLTFYRESLGDRLKAHSKLFFTVHSPCTKIPCLQ
jgi:hypothetical protein